MFKKYLKRNYVIDMSDVVEQELVYDNEGEVRITFVATTFRTESEHTEDYKHLIQQYGLVKADEIADVMGGMQLDGSDDCNCDECVNL